MSDYEKACQILTEKVALFADEIHAKHVELTVLQKQHAISEAELAIFQRGYEMGLAAHGASASSAAAAPHPVLINAKIQQSAPRVIGDRRNPKLKTARGAKHPVQKEVREYLAGRGGWVDGDTIVRALSHIPDSAVISYLMRAKREGKLEYLDGSYLLPGSSEEAPYTPGARALHGLHEASADPGVEDATPERALDLTQPPGQKTREQALDFIRRSGAVTDRQLEIVHVSTEIIDDLMNTGEITFDSHNECYSAVDVASDAVAQ
jgi:hypothetical protein